MDYLAQQIEKAKPTLALSLPKHIDPEKFARVAISVMRSNPTLQKCTPMSIMSSLSKAASDGLMPDGRECALVPYGDQANYQPMVKGILKLIRNSGEIASIQPDVVYTNDHFKFWKDESGTHLQHEPYLDGDRGEFKLAYSIAKTKDGEVIVTVMTKQEVEKVRNSSRSKDSPTWKNWYDEMAKKTVLRRQAKILPSSTDLESIFKYDDELYDVTPQQEPPPSNKEPLGKLKSKILAEQPGEVQVEAAQSTGEEPNAND